MTSNLSKTLRVLIFRVGSLGDTLVALPAMRIIAQEFPNAERILLTNYSNHSKTAPMAQVLQNTGIVSDYIEYQIDTIKSVITFYRKLRKVRPDILIYLVNPKGIVRTLRDVAFFKLCGIHNIVGVPYKKEFRKPKYLGRGIYEYESVRLVRSLGSIGKIDLESPKAFDLCLTTSERRKADKVLSFLESSHPLMTVSIGTKYKVNDWEDQNWNKLLKKLSEVYPTAGLVLLGVGVEYDRSNKLQNNWKGKSLNLCGRLTVLESAAVQERSNLFIGHDSGPLHLAAAVRTPCVGIYSSRIPPRIWFPFGNNVHVIYKTVQCQGCYFSVCKHNHKACILSISVEEVFNVVRDIIDTMQ